MFLSHITVFSLPSSLSKSNEKKKKALGEDKKEKNRFQFLRGEPEKSVNCPFSFSETIFVLSYQGR